MGADPTPRPAPVLARPAAPTPIRRAWFREEVVGSLWFVPICFVVGALALSRLTIVLDTNWGNDLPPDVLLPGDVAAVSDTMGVIAAAMLTFLGLVLSATLIAVQLASSQYSPRIVRIFVRSPLTKVTVGMFLATFVFALNALVGIRHTGAASAPAATVSIAYLLVLATLVVFVFYLHGIVKLLRVQYLLQHTGRDAYEVLDAEFPPADAYHDATAPDPALPSRGMEFHGNTGVLQVIDLGGLAEAAEARGCWVEMLVAVGEHVSPHTPLAAIHGPDPSALPDGAVTAHLLFGQVRTLQQDPAFGLRQLVDTASRALSPAINDPTTAVQALNVVLDLLARIADRPDPTGWYTSRSGAVRVRLRDDSFERLAQLALTEILRYGQGAPQVTRRLAAAYDELDRLVDNGPEGPHRREVIRALRAQFDQAVGDCCDAAFVDVATRPDRMGLG